MNITGTGTALVTPFNEHNQVDFKALEKLINHCINGGVEYLVLLGSTAEAVTLNTEEKTNILAVAKTVNDKRVPLVVGVGGSSTEFVINEIQNFDLHGISAILCSSPAYNKPSQEGIYRHYSTIANASPLPLILYNVPGRTSSNLEPETSLRIAREHSNVIAIKEASPNLQQAFSLLHHKPDGFEVISGDDELALSMTLAGGKGLISVLAQALPKEFSTMIRLALDGKSIEANVIFYKILEIMRAIYLEGNPTGIKALLAELGICSAQTRLPLMEASQHLKERLASLLKNLDKTMN